ncbi:MAG: DUF4834 family protein [Flavobacterium sp.]|nr:MAG: DUF4834 family protein [Flavobacterium sp.]
MQEASMSGLRWILGIIAFYYIFKFLARIFFPILMKKVVEQAGENFQRQQQQQQQYSQGNNWQNTRTNKDEIIIDMSNAKKPMETKKVGDYVDYEEID